ncbi:transcription initiation factor TFIID/TFIIF subunit, partial [Lecanoromycetidae sp. Uapishka_2]
MPEVKRQIKIITEQKIIGNPSEDMPLRSWNIEIYVVGPNGEDMPANIFEKAQYKLHETFEDRQIQTFKRAPFRIQEKGWGEFDIIITVTGIDKGGDHAIAHDLNFQSERYETKHTVIDMEKLADNLQKMTEDDLLNIVQMIHDNKTSETWTKNDVEQGEFQVDLYTLPDSLIRQLWDFTTDKLGAR